MKILSLVLLSFLLFTTACQKSEPPPDYNMTCYTATYGEGIYKSDNGGKSWYPMKMDQEDIHLYFKRLFLNPGKDTLYVATTGAGLFTIDLEKKSLKLIDRYKGQNVRTVAFVKSLENGEYEGLAGVFEEGISRITVEKSNYMNEGLIYRGVNIIITSKDDIFTGTVRDIFKWNEKNRKWVSSSEGIKNKNIISMAVTSNGDALYAGSGGYYDEKGFFSSIPSLYMSKDSGKTWKASDDGIPGDTLVYTIAVNKAKPERIYLGTSNGVYMSDDSGDDWSKTDDGLPDDFRVFDIKISNMADGNDLVYAAGSKGIFMAIDADGPEWIDKNYGLPKTNITGILMVP